MGEARQKQCSRQEFLREHPLCCYCGDTATTTDHCPPRSCFIQRTWPEGYEFPCCESCNARGRRDEQIVAILTRISFTKDFGPTARMEWEKLFRGLRNNQPQVADEWMSIGPSQMKRDFRSKYGNLGDRMRIDGYGAIRLGPLTRSAMHGFSTKLGQALYYMHCKEILEGEVISRHIDASALKENDEAWLNLLQMHLGLLRCSEETRVLLSNFPIDSTQALTSGLRMRWCVSVIRSTFRSLRSGAQ